MDPLTSPRSFTSFSGLSESPTRPRSKRAKTPDKPLPPPPPSPRPPPSPVSLHQIDEVRPQPRTRASTLLDPPPVISKRTHACMELLGSERAYASDLALIRDIHQPLALGQTLPFATAPPTPPSSGSSSRTLSTASDSSTSSAHGAPMTKDDVRIIFNNVADIAVFSDRFTTRLEEALGNVLEGGNGEDHVGALFLEVIPEMEPLYTLYITKHPTALEHLSNLPPSPALTDYLAHTRTLAQSLTHAWDLPSLLIKPVQRLLKYSLLLGAIIDETPDTHGDKDNLKRARERMEAVAHGVNEGRRRREVVKEVLTGVPYKKLGEQQKVKKKGLNVSVSASVNLGRMKSLRASTSSSISSLLSRGDANDEAAKVSKWGEELRETDAFIRQIAIEAVAWGSAVKVVTENLKEWAEAFGHVIGVEPGRASDAFDALRNLVAVELAGLSQKLGNVLQDRFIERLTNLRDTTDAPERLLEAMYTLEPLHNGLLNINVAKTRPSPQLLEASKSYLALRGQLYEELPRYLQLLHKGITHCLVDLSEMQTEFWMEFREKWGNLWDALKVDGEIQGEAAETLRVWWDRFSQVEVQLSGLNILRPPKRDDRERRASQQREVSLIQTPVKPTRRKRATSNSLDMSSTHSIMSVTSVLAALDPFHTPPPPKASPSKSRSMQSLDSMSLSTSTSTRRDRKNSTESLRSRKSGKSIKIGKSPQYHSMSNLNDPFESGSIIYDLQCSPEPIYPPSPTRPTYNRTTSMPISYPQPLKKSASQGRLLDSEVESSASSTRSLLNHTPELEGFLGPAGAGGGGNRDSKRKCNLIQDIQEEEGWLPHPRRIRSVDRRRLRHPREQRETSIRGF
ncbi:hypothetical protein NLI96_g12392 [Meripilus lineatus]|uniref:DH domain-containing protein n=1 Tax=Meripilus lineatus TaxID=2056292 RepID=A0AAD5UQ06_9APHY|nr:hypothetical protein NLI96_g12392 [Physisporinus lineatus]